MERAMLFGATMRLLPDTGPRPRLLSSAVMSPPPKADVTEKAKRDRTGSRVMRFLGKVALVALIAAAVGFWMTRPDNIHEEAVAFRKLVSVGTRVLSTATRPTDPPDAIV